ncbi:MAG TPA: hypothetical protein VK463_07535 [Desulfomonilaceae bacterium]|nr:hypothetical protein [Desulfomonilaceae bacterium]
MMIDRAFIGKTFDSFTIEISPDLFTELDELISAVARAEPWPPPVNWPVILTLHGTACLITLWETLGVDPLEIRLVHEEFVHYRTPEPGETLVGIPCVRDVSQHLEDNSRMEEQVDLSVEFRRESGATVAGYRCSYRVPLTN